MKDIRNIVKNELEEVERCISNLINEGNESFENLLSFIQSKSKRIRSILALLYLKSNNAEVNNDIINLLSSAELIHNASLLHDDVIDEGIERRGEKTVYFKYGAKTSVLYGDYVLSAAMKNILNLKNEQILNMFIETAKKMSEAELSQLAKRGCDTTLEEYLKIIEGKTASLFETVLSSAALLSDLNIKKAGEIGKFFGMIFQINNDLNSISAENDKKNGVNTVINILGIEKTLALKDNYKRELKNLISDIPENMYKKGIEDLAEQL